MRLFICPIGVFDSEVETLDFTFQKYMVACILPSEEENGSRFWYTGSKDYLGLLITEL